MWYHFLLFYLETLVLTVCINSEFPGLQEERYVFKRDTTNDCNTPICKILTAKMISSMNFSADPCEDFHEYVCGNQNDDIDDSSMKNFRKLNKYLRTNVTSESKKGFIHFKKFFDSCIDFNPSLDLIENIKFRENYTSTNLTNLFTELILTQSMPFFDVGMNIQNGTYVFQINPPGRSTLKTELKDWYLFHHIERECEETLENSFIGERVDLVEIYGTFERCCENLLLKYAEKYQEDRQFAGILKTDSLRELLTSLRNLTFGNSQNTNKREYTINDLSQYYNLIEWRIFFEGLASKNLSGQEIIEVHEDEYLKEAFKLMKKYDEQSLVGKLQEFSSFQLHKNVFHIHENRNTFCMDLVHEIMPDIATVIQYGQKKTSQTQTRQLLFKDMKETLEHSVQDSTDLEDHTKETIVEKMKELELGLITTVDVMEHNYKDLVVTDNFKKNFIILIKNYRKTLFSLVYTKSSAATLLTYFVSPFDNVPKTFHGSKFVVLHPAVRSDTHEGYPAYIELAKLGLLLAQGIANHFPPSEIDHYFTEETWRLLQETYLKSPYRFGGTAFEFNVTGKVQDSKNFVAELIADSTAFRMVTDYMKSNKQHDKLLPWISERIPANQIFFIAAAQEFCRRYSKAGIVRDLYENRLLPPPIKIQNMMSNSRTFRAAFECSNSSMMFLSDYDMVQFPYYPENDNNGLDRF